MKRLILAGLLLIPTSVYAQPVAGPNTRYQFDFNTVNFIESGVTRFEIRVDGGTWTSIGIATAILDPTTPPNETRYEHPVGNLSTGIHRTSVRACNTQFCGAPSNEVEFRFVIMPGVPVLRLTQTLVVAGVINKGPYTIGTLSVIDVWLPLYGVTLNFGSPVWSIPGVYTAAVNDKVMLSLSK